MSDIYIKIDKLRIGRKIAKMEFYTAIGMTHGGYKNMIENDTIKLSTLKRIAEVLRVPVSEIFTDKKSLSDKVSDGRMPATIAKFSGEISAEDLETPGPLIAELTQDIMDEDISADEKIILLRERIALQAIEIMKLEKLAEIRLQNIEKLKKQIAG
jgi:DNA-binding Xre family transcriptional regulator